MISAATMTLRGAPARGVLGVALGALLVVACGGPGAQGGGADGVRTDPLLEISAEELYRRGLIVARAGDYTRAEQYMAASMNRGHPPEVVLPSLLEICIESSRMVAALEYAEPYLEQHPSMWSLRLLTASIHMGLGHFDRARSELERVVRDAPEEAAQAHYFLGVIYRDELDDSDLSATHFAHYLALAPQGPHQEEARAGVPTEGTVPQRIDPEDVPPATEGVEPEAAPGAPAEVTQPAVGPAGSSPESQEDAT